MRVPAWCGVVGGRVGSEAWELSCTLCPSTTPHTARRHHTGLYDGAAQRLQPQQHPNGGDGLWGTAGETPSFLYAMPLGGGRVFLEETCLVARPALPFATLKRRLQRRCDALGIKVGEGTYWRGGNDSGAWVGGWGWVMLQSAAIAGRKYTTLLCGTRAVAAGAGALPLAR